MHKVYKERKFESWVEGLLYLAIVIVIPIFPVIIYMITNGESDSYLYILLLTVIISLIYEFMNGYSRNCSIWLKVEHIVSSVVLILMLLITVFLLFLIVSQGYETKDFETIDYILPSLFLVPVINTIIEIIRCIVYDIQANGYHLGKNNLKGASKV